MLIYSCFVASCNDCVLDSTLGNSGNKLCSIVSLSLSKKSKLFIKFYSYGCMGLWTSFSSPFKQSIRFKGEITLGYSSTAYMFVSIYTYVWILCSDFFLNIFARKFLNPRCYSLDCYLDCCYCYKGSHSTSLPVDLNWSVSRNVIFCWSDSFPLDSNFIGLS